jgi:hypothetical protein
VRDRERSGRDIALRDERVVDEDINVRRQCGLAACADLGKRDEARLRGEVRRVLDAAEAHGPAPGTREADRIADAQGRKLPRKVRGPRGVEPHDAALARTALGEHARDEYAALHEPSGFELTGEAGLAR